MVDPVGPPGSVQNISSAARSSQRQNDDVVEDAREQDTVSISEEAISLAEAEQLSSQVGAQISDDSNTVLSNSSERLNALI